MDSPDNSRAAPGWDLKRSLSRRRLLLSGLALAATASLAACGGDDDDDDSSATKESTEGAESTEAEEDTSTPTEAVKTAEATETDAAPEENDRTASAGATETEASNSATEIASPNDDSTSIASASGTDYPKTITHALGDTEIPALPKRIVSVTDTEPLDFLLAVGVKPILYGYTDGYQLGRLSTWVQDIGVDDVEQFDNLTRGEPDVELIAAAGPDLILDVWTTPEVYDQLSGIAPTLVLKNTDNEPWQNIQRLLGEAISRQQKAEEAIAETEAVITEQTTRLEVHAGKTVSISYQFFDELLINGAEVAIGRLIEQLGLTVVAPDPANITFLSVEQWNTVEDADIILSPEFFAEDVAKQEANPLFRSLPQVAAGNYVVLPNEVSQSLYLESTLSVRWGVPLLADALITAAEGNGKKIDG